MRNVPRGERAKKKGVHFEFPNPDPIRFRLDPISIRVRSDFDPFSIRFRSNFVRLPRRAVSGIWVLFPWRFIFPRFPPPSHTINGGLGQFEGVGRECGEVWQLLWVCLGFGGGGLGFAGLGGFRWRGVVFGCAGYCG